MTSRGGERAFFIPVNPNLRSDGNQRGHGVDGEREKSAGIWSNLPAGEEVFHLEDNCGMAVSEQRVAPVLVEIEKPLPLFTVDPVSPGPTVGGHFR